MILTSWSDFEYGSGSSRTAFTTLKIVVAAPIADPEREEDNRAELGNRTIHLKP